MVFCHTRGQGKLYVLRRMYVDTNSGKIDFSSFPLAQSAWGCLPVERPGKHIAHSCATLKINQNWPLLMTSLKSTNVISEKTPVWFSV